MTTTLTYFGSPSGGGAKLAADSTTRVVRSLSDGTVIFCPPGTYSGCLSRMATQSFRASSWQPCAGCPPDASSLAQSPRWRRSASTRAAVRAEPSALAGWLILTWSTLREPLVASVRRTVRCRLCCLRRERWRRSVGAAAYTAQTSAPARLPCVSWAAGRAASSAEASEKRVERAAAGRWRTLPQGEAAARRYGVDRRCLTHGRRGAIRRGAAVLERSLDGGSCVQRSFAGLWFWLSRSPMPQEVCSVGSSQATPCCTVHKEVEDCEDDQDCRRVAEGPAHTTYTHMIHVGLTR